jgi:O-antigen chain-terminating methyltransferase
MRRTLEKLAQERQEKEQEFARRLKDISEKGQAGRLSQNAASLEPILSRLRELLKKEQEKHSAGGSVLARLSGRPAAEATAAFHEQVFLLVREQQNILNQSVKHSQDLWSELAGLVQHFAALMDAKDKEWDALGSNHVGLIFKSLEWRVDKLAAEAGDAKLLMNKFISLREKLDGLLAALDGKRTPRPEEVRAVLEPLEDWRYAGFENRFRGREDEVKKQFRDYVPYFADKSIVLDLGCGRGEFLELLREAGVEASGIDGNGLMVDVCAAKGLRCEKGDLLEKLAEKPDGSLGGVFSSQVIEHVSPQYLKTLIEACRLKLAPEGLLLFETVNPLSVFALVQVYYLDLSHRNPIHPQALKFMLEAAGFDDVEIRYSAPLERERLQPLPGADDRTAVLNRNIDSLNELLFAPVNYAAVARRK